MIWEESKHPRDNDGKFTFKNGDGGILKGGIEKISGHDINIF